MTIRLSIAAFTALGSILSSAQNVTADPAPDRVLEAIQEFNNRDKNKPNEVAVILDPVGTPPADIVPPAPSEAAKEKVGEPVLVTGKPPVSLHESPLDPVEAVAAIPADETPKPPQGLAVRVEKLQTDAGLLDPKQIKLLAPFPAKPLAQPPPGWRLEASDSAPPFTRKVEIAPGSEITLTIRPHRLVPIANGSEVFTISEPGYEPSLGYEQTDTVGAILSNSIRQLDSESKQLGTAIDNLQQLLVSLPKPEPQPEAKAIPVHKK